ncbi:GNAT family N-acetyltransferase [Streptosporangium pseudovulgare]|uniref:Acetyltransferase n=1 Tax=Streptosporangium pseudovulgare TaxID=35765 RepID=A0ABQ2QZ08_9ACTN|nr:GNAT family protein [Streptosporangium pseudovulgare]GGQ04529.1 acetyltransferase [Streptosporangium pseudovulgare]
MMFADKPTLPGDRVTLRPVGPEHVEGLWELVNDPETGRLTGSHAKPDHEAIKRWYASRGEHDNRLDLAICANDQDGAYVGEIVLNDLDTDNLSCNLRIALIGPRVFGRGYGGEAIRLVLRHAFTTTPLHRIHLEAFAFNERALHVYRKAGFVQEGVHRDVLRWDGKWHDSITMAVLAPDFKVREI